MSTKAYDTVKLARPTSAPRAWTTSTTSVGTSLSSTGTGATPTTAPSSGGIGHFRGIPVTMIAIEKGHSAKKRTARSFGAPHPEGYRKALRLMRQAEKFHRPVLCFVDTSGAYCGIGAEERGQGQAIAANLMGMMALNTPHHHHPHWGGGGGALALSVADRVWMLENAVYSVISPEGRASILWKDAGKADEAAQRLKLTAWDALDLGIIERVISERRLGQSGFYTRLADRIEKELQVLMHQEDLLERRYAVPGPGEPLRPAPARPHPPHRPVTDWAGICPRREKGLALWLVFVIYYR